MDDNKVADYFVVAGLGDKKEPVKEITFEGSCMKDHDNSPITDVCIIFPALGEGIPKDFKCIEYTPSGLTADLNYGSLRSPECYLCYRRGRDSLPITDIGVLYEGKERVMADSEILQTTPYGRPANVNNAGARTFLTFRRARPNAPPNALVVSEICVVVTSKGDKPPHSFCMIDKNLNKGMLGSDVYLCYKKSMNRADLIAYQPELLSRYPLKDGSRYPLPPSVPLFCLPMGATIEAWPSAATEPKPVFSTFVLTVSDAAEKVYGSAISFYEPCDISELSEDQKEVLKLENGCKKSIRKNKALCLLSSWPFFDTFERFLRHLQKMSRTGPHDIPIERYIGYVLSEVPFPSPSQPRVLVQLNADVRLSLSEPEDLPIPRRGASFRQLLMNLGPENCLQLMVLVLMEQKVLLHSLRPDVLTSVAEAVAMSIFPLKWICPYVPLCPLALCDVLNSPVPFLIGVDSRFFDLYDPPLDVCCVDLDTNQIYMCDEKKYSVSKLLPKRISRQLRHSLGDIGKRIYEAGWSYNYTPLPEDIALDSDFTRRKKELTTELEIQEAFLRFMSSLFNGYRNFLLPLTRAPDIGATDSRSLFDIEGFVRSRDKSCAKFYGYLVKTQIFSRFIEERSFVSDMDSSLAFFDEVCDKLSSTDPETVERFLDLDSHGPASERTLFLTPPDTTGLPIGAEYSYLTFPTLDPSLMHPGGASPPSLSEAEAEQRFCRPKSPLSKRTQQESRMLSRAAKKHADIPMLWARHILATCFSLWFAQLPSYVTQSKSPTSTLRKGFAVLQRLSALKSNPPDETCHRVMIQLCGQHAQPALAVRVLFELRKKGFQPNAVTYGVYHRAVLEAEWPLGADTTASVLWTKLRNVVLAAALFRSAGRQCASKREREVSMEEDQTLTVETLETTDSPRNGTSAAQDLSETIIHISSSAPALFDSPTSPVDLNSSFSELGRSVERKRLIIQKTEGPVLLETGGQSSDERNSSESREASPVKSRTTPSTPVRISVTENDPLGAFTPTSVTTVITPPTGEIFTPSSEASMFQTWPSKSESETSDSCIDGSERLRMTPSSIMSSISSFKLPFSRSTPGRFSLRKFRDMDPVNALQSLSPGGLKNVAKNVTKRIDELRGSVISSTSPSRNNSSPTSVDDLHESLGSFGSSSWGVPWNRRVSSAEILSQSQPSIASDRESQDGAESRKEGDYGGSSASLSSLLDTALGRGSVPEPRVAADVEINMSSASKCHNCGNIVYDEDILAGWSAEDSNLSTRCPYCCKNIVASLSIQIKDWRHLRCGNSAVGSSNSLSEKKERRRRNSNQSGTDSGFCSVENTVKCHRRSDSEGAKSVGSDTSVAARRPRSVSDCLNRLVEHSSREKLEEQPSPRLPPPINVPFISPLVVRRELESVLRLEGDETLCRPAFVDEHPVIYWNMVWYFERVGLPSHLPRLSLGSKPMQNDLLVSEEKRWTVAVRCKWDNPRVHDESVPPLYQLWRRYDIPPISNDLIDDEFIEVKQLVSEILALAQCGELAQALEKLVEEKSRRRGRLIGLYRDILFLEVAALGRDNVNFVEYDYQYRSAFDQVRGLRGLYPTDSPPSLGASFCRRFFRELEL